MYISLYVAQAAIRETRRFLLIDFLSLGVVDDQSTAVNDDSKKNERHRVGMVLMIRLHGRL